MSNAETPVNWQPIAFLPELAWMVDGMTESAAEQVENLRAAQIRPGSLDDATIDRVIASYTTQRDDLWLYTEQLARWQAAPCTAAQQAEITRLTGLLGHLRADIVTVLDLAEQIKPQTIDSILSMSDAELGLAVLTGKLQPPRAATPQPHPKTPRGKKK